MTSGMQAWRDAYARLLDLDPETPRGPVELVARIVADPLRPEGLDDLWWQSLIASGWTGGGDDDEASSGREGAAMVRHGTPSFKIHSREPDELEHPGLARVVARFRDRPVRMVCRRIRWYRDRAPTDYVEYLALPDLGVAGVTAGPAVLWFASTGTAEGDAARYWYGAAVEHLRPEPR